MKAIVYTEYGEPEVLRLEEVETPSPRDDEVLVRVHATPVGYGDLITRNLKNLPPERFHMPVFMFPMVRLMFGYSRPRKTILGAAFAGEVKSAGRKVSQFKRGDKVFGYPEASFGANAEYLCMKADGLIAPMPSNMTYEEACNVPYGALTALSVLNKTGLRQVEFKGLNVLINGASGSIGGYALQIARSFGAHVTGVCGTNRTAYVKSIGADEVIDYTEKDFTENIDTYDIILDVLGKSSFSQCKKSLKNNGIYLLASFKMKPLLQSLWTKITGGKKVICAVSNYEQKDLILIKNLVEQRKLISVIDRTFPLEKAADAHRYIESGLQSGPVVLVLK